MDNVKTKVIITYDPQEAVDHITEDDQQAAYKIIDDFLLLPHVQEILRNKASIRMEFIPLKEQ